MTLRFRLFLDLDGVLADFDRGVVQATGRTPDELGNRLMWPLLAKTPGFYENLPWTADGRELWDFALPFDPVIVTGVPLGRWAEPQKRAWCARELGAGVEVICCLSREKGRHAADLLGPDETMVLVDDRLKVQPGWDEAGGRFVLHRSAAQSITELRSMGFA